MNNVCCGRIQLPINSGSRAKALVISCTELDELPTWSVRSFLGPFMTMRVPGAIPDVWNSKAGDQLAEMLVTRPNIKHLLICAHSLCRHSQSHTLLHNSWLGNMVNNLREWADLLGRDDLEIHVWTYEPEMEWISALDHETNMFVPLDSCTQLVRARQA